MDKIFIRPATGIRLFNPATKSMVPDSGIFVEKSQYWSRRINEGGAVIFDPKAEAERADLDRRFADSQKRAAAPEPPPAEAQTKGKKTKPI